MVLPYEYFSRIFTKNSYTVPYWISERSSQLIVVIRLVCYDYNKFFIHKNNRCILLLNPITVDWYVTFYSVPFVFSFLCTTIHDTGYPIDILIARPFLWYTCCVRIIFFCRFCQVFDRNFRPNYIDVTHIGIPYNILFDFTTVSVVALRRRY